MIPLLRAVGAPRASAAMFGYLPADASSVECVVPTPTACASSDRAQYTVTEAGLQKVTAPGLVVDYPRPSAPAAELRVRTSDAVLGITHKAVEATDGLVPKPEAPAGWTCCVPPAFE